MPSNGQTAHWPSYDLEGLGLSLDRAQLSRELMNDMSASGSSSQIRPSSESSSLQGTSSARPEGPTLTMDSLREMTRRIERTIHRPLNGMYQNMFLYGAPRRRDFDRINGRTATHIVMDEWSRIPNTPNDDMLDALRLNMARQWIMPDTARDIFSPSIAAMIQPEIGRLDGQVRIIETPKKEPEMNELMIALEAMMRRIVREELDSKDNVVNMTGSAFRDALKSYVDNNKIEFAAIVSQGALDMPWFDDAVKAEVAEATPAVQGVVFADRAMFEKDVRNFIRDDAGVEDWVNDSIVQRVRDMDFSVSVDR